MNEEQTKKCSECLTDIPKKARKCSQCGSKQKGQYGGRHLILVLVLIFGFIWIIASLGGDSPAPTPASQVSRSDGYKLAFIDSKDVQYSEANEGKYNQLIRTIEQKCILDAGQKISDMLVVVQQSVREDAGKEFTLLDIATVVDERLSLGGEKIRCDEYMAAIATVVSS